MIILPEEPDNRQQEEAEHLQWLDEREKEMVDNLDFNLKKMWKQFEHIFEANKPKEASNGTDSQKTE